MQTHFTHTTVCGYKRLGSPLCYYIDGHIETHMLATHTTLSVQHGLATIRLGFMHVVIAILPK